MELVCVVLLRKAKKRKYPGAQGAHQCSRMLKWGSSSLFFFPKGGELYVMRWQLQVLNTAAEAGMDPSSYNHTPL